MNEKRFRSGMLVFPNMTQLGLTGPYEVLALLPGAETLLLWKSFDPVRSEHGLRMLPMAAHAVSEMSNTLTLVFFGRSGATSTASRRMIVPPRSKTTRSSAKPANSADPGLLMTR